MLHYKTIEKSPESPWLVMIHGAGGSSAVWFRQISDYNNTRLALLSKALCRMVAHLDTLWRVDYLKLICTTSASRQSLNNSISISKQHYAIIGTYTLQCQYRTIYNCLWRIISAKNIYSNSNHTLSQTNKAPPKRCFNWY